MIAANETEVIFRLNTYAIKNDLDLVVVTDDVRFLFLLRLLLLAG